MPNVLKKIFFIRRDKKKTAGLEVMCTSQLIWYKKKTAGHGVKILESYKLETTGKKIRSSRMTLPKTASLRLAWARWVSKNNK